MVGLGTIVNVIAIIAGGALGLLLKRVLTIGLVEAIKQALGLGVLVVGLTGTIGAMLKSDGGELSSRYMLLVIISLALGALIGHLLKIEDGIENGSRKIEEKFIKPDQTSSFAEGFITASLLFCIGSMAIIGAIEDGIHSDETILFAKSTLDAISAMVFASALGVGVLFASIPVAIYQGLLTALAVIIAPYLTPELTSQISAVGSVMIIAMGLNMLGVTKIKVSNNIPAIFIPVIYHLFELLYHAIFK